MDGLPVLLLQITIYSAIIFGTIVVFKKVFQKHISASLNYLVWMLLIARLLLPITIESDFKLFEIPVPASTSIVTPAAQTPLEPPASAENAAMPQAYQEVQAVQNTGSQEIAYTQSASAAAVDLTTVIVSIWVLGMLVYFACMLFFHMRFRRKLNKSKACVPKKICDIVNACKKELQIDAPIRILFQNHINTPALMLALRPALLLPEGILFYLNAEQIELCIRHELIHYKRKDHIISLLLLILRGVYWFNPFVWIAFKLIIADMETACDAQVTTHLEKEKKKLYINTLIDIGSSCYAQCALGMGVYKKNMERRIRNMFTMKKSKPFARIALGLLMPLLLLICFTTACQPAFSKIPAIEKTIDSRMQMEIKPNEQITINIDADVIVPEYEKVPIVRLKQKLLSQEQVDTFIKYVFGDNPVYKKHDYYSYLESQEEMDVVLPKLRESLKNNELPQVTKDYLAERIKQIEDDYDSIPKKEMDIPYDGMLNEEGNTTLKSYMGKEVAATLYISQSTTAPRHSMMFQNNDYMSWYDNREPYQGKAAEKIKMSYDKAKATAEEIVLGLYGENGGMTLTEESIGYKNGVFETYSKETSPQQAYIFKFAKSYNGLEVKPIVPLFNQEELKIDYDKQISPDSIEIMIDDFGVCSVIWTGSTEYLETATQDADILDFGEIQQIFKQQCQSLSWLPIQYKGHDNLKATVNVKRAELNLMIVYDQKSNGYITLPVWDFIGDFVVESEVYDKDDNLIEGQKDASILTISAIDGSIINRHYGY